MGVKKVETNEALVLPSSSIPKFMRVGKLTTIIKFCKVDDEDWSVTFVSVQKVQESFVKVSVNSYHTDWKLLIEESGTLPHHIICFLVVKLAYMIKKCLTYVLASI